MEKTPAPENQNQGPVDTRSGHLSLTMPPLVEVVNLSVAVRAAETKEPTTAWLTVSPRSFLSPS